MDKWIIIVIASLVSLFLRSFPFIVFRKYSVPPNSKVSEFLGYSANAVIGGIIYSALYGSGFYHNLSGHFNLDQFVKFLVVVIAFFVAMRTKAIFKTLAVCISIYALFSLVRYGV